MEPPIDLNATNGWSHKFSESDFTWSNYVPNVGGFSFELRIKEVYKRDIVARSHHNPVSLNEFSFTATLTAKGEPDIPDHAMISHLSSEPRHSRVLVNMRKAPVIDLKMLLGKARVAAVAGLPLQADCVMPNCIAQYAHVEVTANNKP